MGECVKMNQKNKLVVLDLDATLISAQSLSSYDRNENRKKASKFDKKFTMDDYYEVFARPNLDVFLDFVFANFRVAVWTAASQLYASSVIDNLILTKPNRVLEFILFDYHNEDSKKRGRGTKDLDLLTSFYNVQVDPKNVIIIDDFNDVCAVNPKNSLRARYFDFKKRNSWNDKFLLNAIPKLRRFARK
ncbi:MAG: HAD family hydrolase [Cyanobacteria bacterium]|nr:HAD family hydrolase [Cyanobacteriota bacterium]